jgi:hypothetical protein
MMGFGFAFKGRVEAPRMIEKIVIMLRIGDIDCQEIAGSLIAHDSETCFFETGGKFDSGILHMLREVGRLGQVAFLIAESDVLLAVRFVATSSWFAS